MKEILEVFKAYSDYEVSAYYAFLYNILPSHLRTMIPLEANKENMGSVLALLDLEKEGYEILIKNWSTDDSRDSDISEDYAYQVLFQSSTQNTLIWVNLSHDDLSVDFFYDIKDQQAEQWILDANQRLRKTFGEKKLPVFNVLTKSKSNGFHMREVKMDVPSMSISEYYNDDFAQVDQAIHSSMGKKKSGLILLHGDPGTGKTSYIKNLIKTYDKTKFIFVQNEFVSELLNPDFISFLLENKDSVLIIEDAEKVITSRDYASERSIVSTILQLTDGLFSDFLNIKIVCTFNTGIDKIDQALLRKGRMIAFYCFKPLAKEKAQKLISDLGHASEAVEDDMTLANIFNYAEENFESGAQQKRKIGF
ncbi:AAA family ATPase [Aureibacter tunicatorum]|uniref:Aromatic ring-cleaving dioxygenase n=1 Tax=Aureibacter tunicatorum TaxID=866807 RepID=A0AAE4BPA0_9BACT|nr:AAA family ATPase [Aureibacter tunicatorum]MDR6237744.1 aromatic ring-cleaving dioxygenase [Aureibacter tunicatorum]BDD02779.1 hypothetical protein AUTU_02620 [Aureibacter tunicatorum]